MIAAYGEASDCVKVLQVFDHPISHSLHYCIRQLALFQNIGDNRIDENSWISKKIEDTGLQENSLPVLANSNSLFPLNPPSLIWMGPSCGIESQQLLNDCHFMTYMAVLARVSCLPLRMISLQLVAKRNHVLCSPSFGIPRIKINPLSSGIHHEVYTRTSAEKASHWNDSFSAIEMLRGFRFVELGGVREIGLRGMWGTH